MSFFGVNHWWLNLIRLNWIGSFINLMFQVDKEGAQHLPLTCFFKKQHVPIVFICHFGWFWLYKGIITVGNNFEISKSKVRIREPVLVFTAVWGRETKILRSGLSSSQILPGRKIFLNLFHNINCAGTGGWWSIFKSSSSSRLFLSKTNWSI